MRTSTHRSRACRWSAVLLCVALAAPATRGADVAPARHRDAYLAFQMFTDRSPLFGGPDGAARRIATRAEIAGWVHGLADRIGTLGSRHRRLAFVVGPLTLDYTDDQLRRLVADAFAVAAETGVAVAFHIDDSMFWSTREAIPASSANVEWLDWNGTPNTGRRLDWDTQPTRIAPQLCYNSPDVRREVARVARDVIGASIRSEVWKLALQERRALFAGVIVGWESQLGRDFATEGMLGYCALANRGYSLTNPPVDIDAERVQIVREFVDLWTASLGAAGLSHRELYGHIAFMTREDFEASARSPAPRFASYAEATNFAPADAAFAPGRLAGFSTYPASDLFPEIYAALSAHGDPPWASSEGTNVVPPGFRGEASMETYLARMYNHGAVLVNLFGWGLGGEAGIGNPFRARTEASESIAAYRRFLSGGALAEAPIPASYGLPAMIAQIRSRVPQWIAAGGAAASLEPLPAELNRAIATGAVFAAAEIAERILEIVGGTEAPPAP